MMKQKSETAGVSIDEGAGTSDKTSTRSSKRQRRHSPSPSLAIVPKIEIEDEGKNRQNIIAANDEGDVGKMELAVRISPPLLLPVPSVMSSPSTFISFTDTKDHNCSICMEPLFLAVYQCDNGHITCFSCSRKLEYKCALCSLPIRYKGCLTVDKVLESFKVWCQNRQHGCCEMIAFNKKQEHEENCGYFPCKCPVVGCNFTCLYKQLYQHSTAEHSSSVKFISYGCYIPIVFPKTENYDGTCLILRAENGVLFVLHNEIKAFGNTFRVSCLRPLSNAKYYYKLKVGTMTNILRFGSLVMSSGSRFDVSTEFLLIPSTYCGCDGQLILQVFISHWSSRNCSRPLANL